VACTRAKWDPLRTLDIAAELELRGPAECAIAGSSWGEYVLRMGPLNEFGKVLVLLGLGIVIVGALLWSGAGKGWLGRLPGDVHYTRGNFSFYFPLMTSLLLSILLTLLLWLFRR